MIAVDWPGVLIGTLGSLLVGVGLWLFLPRGVVLTKAHPALTLSGEAIPDSWKLRNDSSVDLRIVSVRESDPTRGVLGQEANLRGRVVARIRRRTPQSSIPSVELGFTTGEVLRFDDHMLELGRTDLQQPWAGQIVPPGETLTAVVMGHLTSITIHYRRAGWSGLLERRKISIHGFS